MSLSLLRQLLLGEFLCAFRGGVDVGVIVIVTVGVVTRRRACLTDDSVTPINLRLGSMNDVFAPHINNLFTRGGA